VPCCFLEQKGIRKTVRPFSRKPALCAA
jgi:hypothetical protein